MAVTVQPDITPCRATSSSSATTSPRSRPICANTLETGWPEWASKAQVSAEKMWGEMKRQAQFVGQEIEERPFTSALAAFSTGLILGMILNGRRG